MWRREEAHAVVNGLYIWTWLMLYLAFVDLAMVGSEALAHVACFDEAVTAFQSCFLHLGM